jgi:DNA repair protein RecN (Recombination protein N)
MLQRLYIENYALIEQLELDFKEGFTVITGETGAGKSILLGAFSLILGQRAETKVIKEGATKCIVEAEFVISGFPLEKFFEENNLEFVSGNCLIRRELYISGKSRAFVNDSPVQLSILKDLSGQLVDIHSQHQNLLLGKDKFQLDIIDSVSLNKSILDDYRASFTAYCDLAEKLRILEKNALHAKEEEDYIKFQYEQLDLAKLREGEQEELDAEWDMLTHAEEIKSGLGKIHYLLDNEDRGVIQNLKQVLNLSDGLKKLSSKFSETDERFRSDYIDLKDLTSEIEVLLNDVEVNPARLEQVDSRINIIFSLQQKHHVKNVGELISLRDDFLSRLQRIESFDDEILKVKNELNEAKNVAFIKSEKLSESRKIVIRPLERKLIDLLVQLGIPKANMLIKMENKDMDTDGSDKICFLFSANKNSSPQPIDEIASGGEISRIMLGIKFIMAESMSLSTLFFDEIDTGVSGEIAYKMGEIMKNIALKRQVICITHLPQIAARGKFHFKVYKTDNEERSKTTVAKLNEDERLVEIAQMLSGANVTDAAIKNARALLDENK